MPIVLQAREQMTCRGIDKPAGLPPGVLVLNHYMLAISGFVKWLVRYEIGRGMQWINIGGFVTEYLPDEEPDRRTLKPIKTHGKLVVVNSKKGGNEQERLCRVLVDSDGLPVPIPEPLWAAYGLDR